MRLLKVVMRGNKLFEDSTLTLDLFAVDRVSPPDDGPQPDEVHQLSPRARIYSQNVVGIAGINASGKTTTLRILRLALTLLLAPYHYRTGDADTSPIPAKMGDRATLEIIFWQSDEFYLLESTIAATERMGEPNTRDWYRIEDETIWQLKTHRPAKAVFASTQHFRDNAFVILRRNGEASVDATVVPKDARRFLRGHISIASALVDDDAPGVTFKPDGILKTDHATSVVQAFDKSVEHMLWDEQSESFEIKFSGERERLVDQGALRSLLSGGTAMGVTLVERAIEELSRGGFLVVDELEDGLNKSLLSVIIGLFQSAATNPLGAQLVFSTHYVELLDYLPRKDDVYVLTRREDHLSRLTKYSDVIKRIENKKSEVLLANVIRGSLPSYESVEALRAHVRRAVNAQA